MERVDRGRRLRVYLEFIHIFNKIFLFTFTVWGEGMWGTVRGKSVFGEGTWDVGDSK